jgi:hypothetical protein
MGHTLPHAFTADGSFVFTLENAVSHLVNQLYRGLPFPTSPQSQATPKQVERNAEIRAKYKAGTNVPDLAREYGISKITGLPNPARETKVTNKENTNTESAGWTCSQYSISW